MQANHQDVLLQGRSRFRLCVFCLYFIHSFQWGRLPRLQIVNSNESRNSMEQLSVAEGKLGNVMTRLLGVDIFNKKLEMDEER